MNRFIISLIVTSIAGISTLIGGFIPFINIKDKDKIIVLSLSFASGIMVSISLLDLLPSSLSYLSNLFLVIVFFIVGVIIFYLFDKISGKNSDNLYRIGIFSMIAIIVHNVPEGIITFILSNSNLKLGILMSVGIALHNIPEGISIMVPIYYGTNNFKKAFFYTLLAGISEPIGGVVFYLLFKDYISSYILGILFSMVAGIMIYLSLSELLPKSLSYQKNNTAISSFMIGIIFFLLVHIFLN